MALWRTFPGSKKVENPSLRLFDRGDMPGGGGGGGEGEQLGGETGEEHSELEAARLPYSSNAHQMMDDSS